MVAIAAAWFCTSPPVSFGGHILPLYVLVDNKKYIIAILGLAVLYKYQSEGARKAESCDGKIHFLEEWRDWHCRVHHSASYKWVPPQVHRGILKASDRSQPRTAASGLLYPCARNWWHGIIKLSNKKKNGTADVTSLRTHYLAEERFKGADTQPH